MASKHKQSAKTDGLKSILEAKSLSKSERRSGQVFSDSLRKSLQTCRVEENEGKLEGLLEFYKIRKRYHKTQVIEALLFILRQLLASSSNEDARGRGFLHFMEAFGLYSSFFEKPVEKQEFKDQLLHEEYGLRVFIATIQSTRYFPFSINLALGIGNSTGTRQAYKS